MRPFRWGLRARRPGAPEPVPVPAPKRVLLPLEWGETALVSPGERVLLGQKLADGAGETVPLHASVSGLVSAVLPHACAGGRRCTTLVLENDGKNRPDPSIRPRPLLEDLPDELLLTLLYEAGLRLPDGRPLGAVASSGMGAPLVFSAMDEEPGLCAGESVLLYDREAALSGIWLLARLLRPKKVTLALGSGQRDAIRALSRRAGRRLELAIVAGPYPAGHPRRLAVRLGAEGQRAVVLPVSAAAACAHAAYEGIPALTETVCLCWGGGRSVYTAPLGTPVRALIEAAGQNAAVVLRGGPFSGRQLESLDVPVVKGMTALTLLEGRAEPERTGCIRCGRCAAVCPVGLSPWRSRKRGAPGDWSACLRCGVCEYVCPAGIPLLRDMGREARRLG